MKVFWQHLQEFIINGFSQNDGINFSEAKLKTETEFSHFSPLSLTQAFYYGIQRKKRRRRRRKRYLSELGRRTSEDAAEELLLKSLAKYQSKDDSHFTHI